MKLKSKRRRSLGLFLAALSTTTLTACGGGGSNTSPTIWTVTELLTGSPQYVTTTGFCSFNGTNTVTVASPGTSSVDYPVGMSYVLANNGGVVEILSGGFDQYKPGSMTPVHADYPAGQNYDGVSLADSNNRVFGTVDNATGKPVKLWDWVNGVFTVHTSPYTGYVRNRWIDSSDRITLEVTISPGSYKYVRYTYPDTWDDLGTIPATNPVVVRVDGSGNLCGSNNLGGDSTGTAIVYNRTTLKSYAGIAGYDSASALGTIGPRVFGVVYQGTTSLSTVWEGGSVSDLKDRLDLGVNQFVAIDEVTDLGVIVIYKTPQNTFKTGFFMPN